MADIPPGWAAIDAALIAVIGGPLVFFLVRILGRLKKVQADAATTVYHVANEHRDERGDPINLRDDNDEKHAETMSAIGALGKRLGNVEKDIGGMRHELRTLHTNDGEQVRQQNRDREQAAKIRQRLEDLERTIPRDERGRFVRKDDA